MRDASEEKCRVEEEWGLMAEFNFPNTHGGQQQIVVNAGKTLFVVGANGSGKSSLMQRFYTQHRNNAKRISAHRQTWFTSNTLDFTPTSRKQTGVQMEQADVQETARWKDELRVAAVERSDF